MFRFPLAGLLAGTVSLLLPAGLPGAAQACTAIAAGIVADGCGMPGPGTGFAAPGARTVREDGGGDGIVVDPDPTDAIAGLETEPFEGEPGTADGDAPGA